MSGNREPAEGRPLLFLGFDGVLHPKPCERERYLEKAPLFEEWLRSHPAVDIVITSGWRCSHSLDRLAAKFSEDLRARFIGTTPDDVPRGEPIGQPAPGVRPQLAITAEERLFIDQYGHRPGERELEIWVWRRRYDRVDRPWRVLDDCEWLFHERCKELILVHWETGITPDTLALLDAWLDSSRRLL
ncbi:MAG: hypothetical protein RLZZ598_1284 [Pseudomonadota bacterium]